MSEAADPSGVPTLAEFAAAHGMRHRLASLALPKATQLMRHGFLQEVRSLASGSLPGGLDNCWLAQVDYVYEGNTDLERSNFTLLLVEAERSSEFAVRVLCHDRGLGKRDRENPDADREVVRLDDSAVRLESDRFLERYALSTDHDQDQVAVWQIFSPSLIEWLTNEAPAGFSFELQDGALSCFVPVFTAEEAALDGLCAAAARVFARVAEIDGPGGSATPREGTRADAVERELAAHPFDAPPKSTKAAAKEFRRGLKLGDRAWALGAEAFLLFTDNDDYEDMGWSVLVVDLRSPLEGFAVAQSVPRGDNSVRGTMQAGCDGRALILSALDGGRRDRKAAEFEAFFAAASELAARLGG